MNVGYYEGIYYKISSQGPRVTKYCVGTMRENGLSLNDLWTGSNDLYKTVHSRSQIFH